MMKKNYLGWIFLGFAGLGALFFLFSFRIISSRLALNSGVATSHPSQEAGPVAFSELAPQLVVEGDDPLSRALRKEIMRMKKSEITLGQVNLTSAQDVVAQSPLLVVRLRQQSGYWTPMYSQTDLQVEAAYASNGDVSFRESEPTKFHLSESKIEMQYEGHYQLTDISWGVMSLPGYQDYLACQIAVTILTSLEDQLKL
jgi:hypothetical protein